jgi:hypothetical protein
MTITFRTGPLLTDPSTIRLPRPAENNGAWGWVAYQPGVAEGAGTYQQQPIIAADGTARLGDPTGVSEGWLQFAPKDLS